MTVFGNSTLIFTGVINYVRKHIFGFTVCVEHQTEIDDTTVLA